ncbi:MAG TPA: DEAD/DEAH box helicase family protein [Euzebyales bacterium]|nr:DEAD/DEAH box helicase family protein [Euzebyales bacterium]
MDEDRERSQAEVDRLRRENQRLRQLLGLGPGDPLPGGRASRPSATALPLDQPNRTIDARSSEVALFRSLFRGRDDVYAVRWSNQHGESGYVPAVAGGWRKDRPRKQRRHLALTDDVIRAHLEGDETIGLYPLLEDDHCWLLAADFDGPNWRLDALAYRDGAAEHGVPAYLERSRSGDGAHVWTFFSEPVTATDARRLGTGLLRTAINARAELALDSYDRLFPSQDLAPRGSFGNLIALPLQGRAARDGNSVFLDHNELSPVEDQWRLLGQVDRVIPALLATALRRLAPMRTGRDEAAAWRRSGRQPKGPARIAVTADARLRVDKSGLSTSMLAAIKHLASVSNPEFFAKQRLRLSTWQTPRVIRAYDEDLTHLHLPRGLRAELEELAQRAGSTLDIQAAWPNVEPLDVAFRGVLTAQQQDAVSDLTDRDLGVLVSPPGTGKTVMGCALIAAAGVPSLVLVYRKPLLEQWRDQLGFLLGLDADQIGQLTGGRDRRSGVVDIATVQTLARRDDVAELTNRYGLLIVDECHHVPAVTIGEVVGQIPARRVLGLTATPYRQDGLDALIAMHCGPIRHHPGKAPTGLKLRLEVHDTRFRFPSSEQAAIQQIFTALAEDPRRTRQIATDVADAVAAGRRCLVLSERKAHLAALANELREHRVDVVVLHGSLSRADEQRTMDRLETIADQPVAVVATGQYVGEGFDCPPLDTLFVAFPLSSKGKIVQYVGRVLRPFDGKHTVLVHDYHDAAVPALSRMHDRRRKAYRSLGLVGRDDHQPQLSLDL